MLSYLHTHLSRLERLLSIISGVTVFLLVLLSVAQVLSRNLFNLPIIGFIDWVEQSMAVFAFCGLAYCQANNKHIRMDLIINKFQGRLYWIVELINNLLSLLLFSVLIIGSYFHFSRALNLGDSTMDIQLPTWPGKLIIVLMFAVIIARLILQIWDMLRLVWRLDHKPITIATDNTEHIAEDLTIEGGR